ncbi:hypothetical protein SAMN05216483_4465 [Streptomyces sp. 2131.1]|uniref:hypothetical protein n=1 Tax=Streptomyces sp. 2131.1 TaxID=1855346 RepID=UPI000897A6D1|nr:hypothetical protein [Streptomyces sp. 2131.1]SED74745.1 hypothetical protein SAMN05216483_4465 [Streptomyces sp. 2131.1]
MNVVIVLILVAVLAPITFVALAPKVPARRNAFPGRSTGRSRRRPAGVRLSEIPRQQADRHHAR